MKTQFGNDPKRENLDRRLRIVSIILLAIFLAIEMFEIISGRRTWIEAIKSDGFMAFMFLGMLPGRFAFYVGLVFLPVMIWMNLNGSLVNLEATKNLSPLVWMMVLVWLFYASIFLSLVFTGKLFSKNSAQVKS